MIVRRRLGNTEIEVSPVALGCWPIAGMTSPGVRDEDSLATLAACVEVGINFLDTAYGYGEHGESERLIAQALGLRRRELVIATKGGIEWDAQRKQVLDARPARLKQQCEESLRRLQTDYVDLLYLHAPDRTTPVAESAGALRELLAEGKTRSVGVSNVTLSQLQEVHQVVPVTAVQPPYNMLQRQIETELIPWCREHQVAVVVYWPLMKGLLAGKLSPQHEFAPGDSRRKYPMFQGEEWHRNLAFVERLREIAAEAGKTVAQLVVNWTIAQAGITAALCGAKRPDQIRETAGAMGWSLTADQRARIEQAIADRGEVAVRNPV